MQAVNILPKEVVPGESPSTPILYEIAWQVTQPVSQVYTHAISKDCESYWSIMTRKETYVYLGPACSSVSLARHSFAYVAIQDVAMVQQCLNPENFTKEVKLETKNALTFPMLDEGFGKHSSCNLKILRCILEPCLRAISGSHLMVKADLINILVSEVSSM